MIRRSRAGLRYSAAMRVAILVYRSCCLPFALVLLSHPDSPPLFVHPLSLPVKSSFFSALPSHRVRSTPRARFSLPLLFRSAFCPRVSSRARGRASLTSPAASYSSNSCRRIENSIHAFGIQQWEYLIREGKSTIVVFYILKMYEVVPSLLEGIAYVTLFKF